MNVDRTPPPEEQSVVRDVIWCRFILLNILESFLYTLFIYPPSFKAYIHWVDAAPKADCVSVDSRPPRARSSYLPTFPQEFHCFAPPSSIAGNEVSPLAYSPHFETTNPLSARPPPATTTSYCPPPCAPDPELRDHSRRRSRNFDRSGTAPVAMTCLLTGSKRFACCGGAMARIRGFRKKSEITRYSLEMQGVS